MNVVDQLEFIKLIKNLATECGKVDKDEELRTSEYMEPEYQESDLARGAKLIKNILEYVVECEESQENEIEEAEALEI